MTKFTKEQLIARIEKQIDINATIIERLGDDSAATSKLAVKTATMDIKILDIALAALTAEPFAWADDAGMELLEMRYPAEVTAKKDDDFIFPLYRLPEIE